MLILGLAAIAAALAVGIYLILRPAAAAGGAGTAGIADLRMTRATAPPTDPDELPSLYRRMGALAGKVSPADYLQRVQRRLDLAGNPRGTGAERLLAWKGFGLIGGGLLGLLFGSKHGLGATVLLTAAFAGFGLFLPDILVKIRGEHRQIELQKGLPDAMDMLTVCVEAGLGFDAAMSRVARNLEGPMAEEAARVLQEMQFGMSRSEALRSLLNRTDVAELRGFVSAIIQSSELGISIGDVLREQAKEMRISRRQRAEEKAQRLQVKILMPLIFCLLPAMFVVILAPAGIQILHFFHQANH